MKRAALLGLALILAACGEKPSEETAKSEAEQLPLTQAKATSSEAYVCEKDMPITAIYGTDALGKADVALIVQGMDLRLTEASSPSGKRFTSETGLEAGNGIVWWVDGEEAQLQRVPLDKLGDPDAATTIRSCRLKTEPAGAEKAK